MNQIVLDKNKTINKLFKIWFLILLSINFLSYIGILINSSFNNYLRIACLVIVSAGILLIDGLHNNIKLGRVVLILIYFVLQMISLINSGASSNIYLSILEIIVIICIYVILAGIEVDERFVESIFRFIIAIGFLLCMYNMYENIDVIFDFWKGGNAYANSTSCIFSNKNAWGQFLLPVAAANIYMISKKCTIRHSITLITLIYNIVASYSRTTILVMGIFIVFYWLLTESKNMKRNILLSIIAILGFAVLLSNSTLMNYITTNYFKEDLFTGRGNAWKIGIEHFLKIPLLGVGVGQSEQILHSYGLFLPEFHNSYVEYLVSGGILGFCMIFIIVIHSLKSSINIYIYNKRMGGWLISFTVAILVYFLFESLQLFGASVNQVLIAFFIIALPHMLKKNYIKK